MSSAIDIEGCVAEQQKVVPSIAKPQLSSPLNFTRRITELDGYRGMAVAIALFFHYIRHGIIVRPPHLLGYLYTTTPLIWSGMELFFILSGFLITGILLDSRQSPNYFKTYYIRRACRILPLYLLFLGLVWLVFHFLYRSVGKPLDWVFTPTLPWYSFLTFGQNFWMAKLDTYGPATTAITWSLAIEEQFYLSLPLLVRFIRRPALPFVFGAGVVLAPIFRLFIVYHYPSHLLATCVLLPARMDALCFGALCAYYIREPKAWNWMVKNRQTIWKVFFGLVICMPLLSTDGVPLTLLWLVIGIGWMSAFYVTVLILVLTNSQCVFSRAMRLPLFTSLGRIAYSIFLFHLGIYLLCLWALTGHEWIMNSWKDFGVALLSLAITISLCKLLWRYFEKPIIGWSHAWKY
ncbi:MAG TPA: acyltransferase [Candidatus Saccharimonadales bacterium]|nr:acyltransferase [Candidatus Saccharimonadales bacterium]